MGYTIVNKVTNDVFKYKLVTLFLRDSNLITARNEVAAGLCFYTCLSFCPQGGGCLPYTDIPLWADTPRADTPWADTSLHSACWDTVNKQAVRILLECILAVSAATSTVQFHNESSINGIISRRSWRCIETNYFQQNIHF